MDFRDFHAGDTVRVIATGEEFQVARTLRPYGTPYVEAPDGRCFHYYTVRKVRRPFIDPNGAPNMDHGARI